MQISVERNKIYLQYYLYLTFCHLSTISRSSSSQYIETRRRTSALIIHRSKAFHLWKRNIHGIDTGWRFTLSTLRIHKMYLILFMVWHAHKTCDATYLLAIELLVNDCDVSILKYMYIIQNYTWRIRKMYRPLWR